MINCTDTCTCMYFIIMQMAMRYSIVHICNPLYYGANGTCSVYVWRCTLHLGFKRCIWHTHSANGTRYSNVQLALMYGKCAYGTHYVNFCANSTCIQGSSICYYVECIHNLTLLQYKL